MNQQSKIRRGALGRGGAAASVAALLIATTVGTAEGQGRPQFSTTVEVVQMQVAVADSRGVAIPFLGKDDFALFIDGQPRDIVAVYEVDLRRDRISEFDEDQYVPPAGWRQWLLFFDFGFNSPWGIIRARDAARTFVESQVHPRDLIAVATYSLGGVQLLSPFTADRSQILDVIGTLGLSNAPKIVDAAGFVIEPAFRELEGMVAEFDETFSDASFQENATRGGGVSDEQLIEDLRTKIMGASKSDFNRYSAVAAAFVDQIGELGKLMTATRGRKNVLMFSQGFDNKVITGQSLDELAQDNERAVQGQSWMINSDARFGDSDVKRGLVDAIRELQNADAVFYTLDTSGLGGDTGGSTFLERGDGRDTLFYLADETDGAAYWNLESLTPALGEIAEKTSQFYVVAYRKAPDDPPVVDVRVEPLTAGATITAAPKRLAPPPAYADMNEAQRQMQLSEFIVKGIDEEDMIFDLRAIPYRGTRYISRVAVVLEIPWEQLTRFAREREDGKTELDLMGYVLDDQGEIRDLFNNTIRLNVDAMAENLAGLPFRYYNMLWALPGDDKVRVLVRERKQGHLSTRTEAIEIPVYQSPELIVSDPIAIDGQHPGLMMRGLDPASPPSHRQNGSNDYPFVLGEQELTPQVYTVTTSGGSCHFLMVATNLGKHPFTGQTHVALSGVAFDELGAEHAMEIALVGQYFDVEDNTTSMLIEAQVPKNLPPGAYLLEVTLVDGVAGATAEKLLPFLIGAGTVTDG